MFIAVGVFRHEVQDRCPQWSRCCKRFRCTHWHSSVCPITLCAIFSEILITVVLGFSDLFLTPSDWASWGQGQSCFYSSLCAQGLIPDKYSRIEWWKKHEWNNFHLLILQLAWSCTRNYKILDQKRTLVVSWQYSGKAGTSCLWYVTPVQHSLHAPALVHLPLWWWHLHFNSPGLQYCYF